MYKIEKIPTRKRGFNREQLNIIALRLLEAVNECNANLITESGLINTKTNKDYGAIKIHIPMSNCVLNIEPTTGAINRVLKRLGIKLERI